LVPGAGLTGNDTATLKDSESRLHQVNLLSDTQRRSDKLFPERTRRDVTHPDFR